MRRWPEKVNNLETDVQLLRTRHPNKPLLSEAEIVAKVCARRANGGQSAYSETLLNAPPPFQKKARLAFNKNNDNKATCLFTKVTLKTKSENAWLSMFN